MGETHNQYQVYLKNPKEYCFFPKETEPIKTLKLFKDLNLKKSSDIYRILPKFIKIVDHSLAEQSRRYIS